MKFGHTLFKFSFIILFCMTCTEPDVTPRNYPRVKTLSVDNITATGARFEAEITFTNQPITEHGFLWSTGEPSLNNSEIINLGETEATGVFSVNVERSLETGNDYFVCGYVKAGNRVVYGNVLSFRSLGSNAPQINKLEPPAGFVMDTIAIRGKNFSNLTSNVKVAFDELLSLVVSVSDTLLQVQVPRGLSNLQSTVSVTVSGNVGKSPEKFALIPPEILSVSQQTVATGDTLIVSGKNFSSDRFEMNVFLDDALCKIITHSSSELKVTVPFIRTTADELILKVVSSNLPVSSPGKIKYLKPIITALASRNETTFGDTIRFVGANLFSEGLTVKLGASKVNPIRLTRNYIDVVIPDNIGTSNEAQVSFSPNIVDYKTTVDLSLHVVSSVSPSLATFNDEVTITGRNFHPLLTENEVTFADYYRAKVISVTQTTLKVKVPPEIENCSQSFNCNKLRLRILNRSVSVDDKFTLRTPVIESVEPAEITNTTGTMLTVRGKFFNPNNTNFNRTVIDGRLFDPLSATSETLVFDAAQLLTSPLLGEKRTTSIQVGNGNSYPISLNIKGSYSQKAKFPGGVRSRVVKAVINNEAYVGLGTTNSGENTFNDFYKYNPVTDTWTRLADFPGAARRYQVSFSLGDFVYVGMGLVSNGSTSTIATDMWRYNVNTNTWQQIADYPGLPKYKPFAFTAGDKAYVGGGDLVPFGATKEFWTFDGSTWLRKNDLPDYNSGAEVFVQDNTTTFVFFGKKLFKYNAAMDSWNHINDYPSSSQLFFFTGGMIDGAGYLWATLGGSTSTMLKYNIALNSWEYLQSPAIFYNLESFIIDSKLYGFMGIKGFTANGSVPNEDLWEFDYTLYPF